LFSLRLRLIRRSVEFKQYVCMHACIYIIYLTNSDALHSFTFWQACELIARSNILSLTYQLFQDELSAPHSGRSLETEMLLQLLHLFYRLLLNDIARQELMCSTQIIADIIKCIKLRHPGIRRICIAVVDLCKFETCMTYIQTYWFFLSILSFVYFSFHV